MALKQGNLLSYTPRKGQALVEVIIATMIAAMTTMSVFSVILSAMVSQKKADKREAAALVLKYAQEALKSYISVDPLNTNIVPGAVDASGSPKATPGSPVGPAGAMGHWSYDTSTNGWALAAGTHYINGLLASPPNPTNFPLLGGTLRYTVADYDCLGHGGTAEFGSATGTVPGNAACKIVVFTLDYPD